MNRVFIISLCTLLGAAPTALGQVSKRVAELERQLVEMQEELARMKRELVLTNTDGKELARLRDDPEDGAELTLFNQAGERTVLLEGGGGDGDGHLHLRNHKGKEEVFLGVSPGRLSLYDETEKRTVLLGTDSKTGGGVLQLQDKSGTTWVSPGQLSLYDETEKRTVFLGPDSKTGGGLLQLQDKSGTTRVHLGASDAGGGFVFVNDQYVHDFAEIFELTTREGVQPGVVLSAASAKGLAPSSRPYDPAVVGVVSGAGGLRPGMVLGTRIDGTSDLPVALSGTVYVQISGEGGPVGLGDLLVASSRPGVAMRAASRERAFGAVIGKALEAWATEDQDQVGLVRMLVMAR
jgi:hypothetical protein